jgi:hypothetical protein
VQAVKHRFAAARQQAIIIADGIRDNIWLKQTLTAEDAADAEVRRGKHCDTLSTRDNIRLNQTLTAEDAEDAVVRGGKRWQDRQRTWMNVRFVK